MLRTSLGCFVKSTYLKCSAPVTVIQTRGRYWHRRQVKEVDDSLEWSEVK